jgi:hypothetical protein
LWPLFSGRNSIDESNESPDSKEPNDAAKDKRSKVSTLNLTSTPPDPIIVHASVLTAMLKLLPCLAGSESGSAPEDSGPKPESSRIRRDDRLSLTLQFHLAEVIKSLLRTEKNQQVKLFSGKRFLTIVVGQSVSVKSGQVIFTLLLIAAIRANSFK